ncbi:MAG: glycerol-3-phosphate 1-O-acyltransferase PlsY [bacterium]|nr:glycerol-3-phosphate 1-O-acyltransferase PlsY [bacterium]
MTEAGSLIVGYLVGGIPTGILVCRAVKGVDPRTTGSGGMGATNVSRVLGKKWALLVLFADGLKGYVPVWLIAPLFASASDPKLSAALMTLGLVIGHIWTPYAGLRGGKGVATGAGAMLALDWRSLLIALGVWGVSFAARRIVSLASICAAVAFPLAMLALSGRSAFVIGVSAVVSVIIVVAHRGNLDRLLRGEEKSFGSKS